MGAPLYDITIYYDENEIPSPPKDYTYRLEMNFISELYHMKMHGYKPPKTSRLTIRTADDPDYDFQPSYFGSILSFGSYFDSKKFLSLESKKRRYKFILDFIHKTCLRLASLLKWDKEVFIRAFNESVESDFHNIIEFPEKRSPDRKKKGHVILEKTEQYSRLNFIIMENDSIKEIQIYERKNWYPLDQSLDVAKNCKWLSNEHFGYRYKKTDKVLYYDLVSGEITKTIKFVDEQ